MSLFFDVNIYYLNNFFKKVVLFYILWYYILIFIFLEVKLKTENDKKDIKTQVDSNKKIKVALFIDTFFPMIDGVIMVVDNYARLLSDKAEVMVFCPKAEKDYKDEFVYKVSRCKKMKIFFLDYDLALPTMDKKFEKSIEAFAPDIVHIHSPFSIGKVGVDYAKKHNLPLVGTIHSHFKQDFYRATKSNWLADKLLAAVMKIFNACDECWTVNNAFKDLYINEYGLTVPVKIQNNATEVKELVNKETAIQKMEQMFGIKPNENMFLFVGRINALKNIFFIVDALKIVKDKGVKFKMLFVGSGQDEEKLKEYITKNGLDDEIIMSGRLEDRQDVIYAYSRADLFLFPSLYDSNSLVQIEAASQKTPTVFIRDSVTSSTVEDGVSGFKTENDAESYAEKIIEIINDKETLSRVSQGAYDNLYKTWDDVVESVYKGYLRLIEAKEQGSKEQTAKTKKKSKKVSKKTK